MANWWRVNFLEELRDEGISVNCLIFIQANYPLICRCPLSCPLMRPSNHPSNHLSDTPKDCLSDQNVMSGRVEGRVNGRLSADVSVERSDQVHGHTMKRESETPSW